MGESGARLFSIKYTKMKPKSNIFRHLFLLICKTYKNLIFGDFDTKKRIFFAKRTCQNTPFFLYYTMLKGMVKHSWKTRKN